MKGGKMARLIQQICAESPRVGSLATHLYDEISSLACRSPNVYISYNIIFDIANSHKEFHSECDELDVFSAIQVLCNPRVDFLKLNYQFIDDIYGTFEVSISDVIDAEKSHFLEHPYTGELVENYKEFVFPFYTVKYECKKGDR
ncbi:hypothetical protein AA9G20_21610 [Klebsiella pneumoniae]|uniref:hypothetical protein n=1 Tax=Klebsiella pneumoniae TaxID=573 RepID=UPI00221E741A|nr:hypothetical protein [Klebsiella pneumoniae]MCW1144240.1 hypothetical protein [Klebsiella pneumoniae]